MSFVSHIKRDERSKRKCGEQNSACRDVHIFHWFRISFNDASTEWYFFSLFIFTLFAFDYFCVSLAQFLIYPMRCVLVSMSDLS